MLVVVWMSGAWMPMRLDPTHERWSVPDGDCAGIAVYVAGARWAGGSWAVSQVERADGGAGLELRRLALEGG